MAGWSKEWTSRRRLVERLYWENGQEKYLIDYKRTTTAHAWHKPGNSVVLLGRACLANLGPRLTRQRGR